MIKSIRDRDTQLIWDGRRSRRLPPEIQQRALDRLLLLNAATDLDDLRAAPGNRLEPLRGNRTGQWSIRINDQWRICFRWNDGAEEVEIVDYH